MCGLPNLSTFLATFPCQANTNGTKYFYFEAFDQPWQGIYGGIEPYWGLWDANKVSFSFLFLQILSFFLFFAM